MIRRPELEDLHTTSRQLQVRAEKVQAVTDDLTLRPARPKDADRAAVLLYSAYRHRQVTHPLQEAAEHQFLERLAYFFRW